MECRGCKYWERIREDETDNFEHNKNFGFCDKNWSNFVRVYNANFANIEGQGFLPLSEESFSCINFEAK